MVTPHGHSENGTTPRRVRLRNNDLHVGISARGGLEPRFMVLFSAIFHGVPSEIAIRVENRGVWWKQNCCKLLQV
jgi:hypothetical protein